MSHYSFGALSAFASRFPKSNSSRYHFLLWRGVQDLSKRKLESFVYFVQILNPAKFHAALAFESVQRTITFASIFSPDPGVDGINLDSVDRKG